MAASTLSIPRNEQELAKRIAAEVGHVKWVVDVGSGIGAPYHDLCVQASDVNVSRTYVMIEPHVPYLAQAKNRFPTAFAVLGEAIDTLGHFDDDTFDVALAIDVVEHLEDEAAGLLIKQLQRVSKKIVLFIPEGHHPQDKDYYNLGGDHWQTHRSTWYAPKLAPYGITNVEVWPNFHAGAPGKDSGAIWAIWTKEEAK